MRHHFTTCLIILMLMTITAPMSQAKSIKVAFWNVENLFNEYNNPETEHEDVFEAAEVEQKLKMDAEVLGKLDADIIGLSEVEHLSLLRRLVDGYLSEKGYDYLYLLEGPDSRGIDVAIISRYPALVRGVDVPDFYRDLLLGRFSIEGQPFYLIVNHWKSRRDGGEQMRLSCAKTVVRLINEEIPRYEGASVPVIVVGDFNDEPEDASLKLLDQAKLINTTTSMSDEESWTLGYYNRSTNQMQLQKFDQILISPQLQEGSKFRWEKTSVYRPRYMINPRRVYNGISYPLPLDDYRDRIGYSDHFPVYATFIIMD